MIDRILNDIVETYYGIFNCYNSEASDNIKLAITSAFVLLILRQSSRLFNQISNLYYRKRFVRILQNFDKFDWEVPSFDTFSKSGVKQRHHSTLFDCT